MSKGEFSLKIKVQILSIWAKLFLHISQGQTGASGLKLRLSWMLSYIHVPVKGEINKL